MAAAALGNAPGEAAYTAEDVEQAFKRARLECVRREGPSRRRRGDALEERPPKRLCCACEEHVAEVVAAKVEELYPQEAESELVQQLAHAEAQAHLDELQARQRELLAEAAAARLAAAQRRAQEQRDESLCWRMMYEEEQRFRHAERGAWQATVVRQEAELVQLRGRWPGL